MPIGELHLSLETPNQWQVTLYYKGLTENQMTGVFWTEAPWFRELISQIKKSWDAQQGQWSTPEVSKRPAEVEGGSSFTWVQRPGSLGENQNHGGLASKNWSPREAPASRDLTGRRRRGRNTLASPFFQPSYLPLVPPTGSPDPQPALQIIVNSKDKVSPILLQKGKFSASCGLTRGFLKCQGQRGPWRSSGRVHRLVCTQATSHHRQILLPTWPAGFTNICNS